MDDTNKSTVEEPLKYFRWMFIENGINHYKDSYFESYYLTDAKVDLNDEKVVYFRPISLEEEVETIECFADKLKAKLESEMSIIKKHIDSAIAKISFQGNNSTHFINLQMNILSEIQTNSNKYIEQYPFITTILNNIALYIKKVQTIPLNTNKPEVRHGVNEDTSSGNIETNIVESTIADNPVQQSIIYIFGYFKDRMEPKHEYDRLIESITSFVDTGVIPDSGFRKFRHIYNIKSEEIRYTFYVFYSKNKKKLDRKKLCFFIISIFEDFSNVTQRYVYSKLSTPPNEFSLYIPNFIRDFKD